jgi:plastocyanin
MTGDAGWNTVVYLEGGARVPQRARVTRVIRQHNLRFRPHVTVIPRGSTIEFPNDDRVDHNVFSLSRPKRFDLGLYRSGTSRSVTFRRPGVVDIYCNIHPQMAAKVLVVDTPHYATATARGRFQIRDVPAGDYELVGWQPYGESFRRSITVRPRQTTNASFSLTPGRRATRHLRKDGTPYGRYR